jgi:hypothetical protein
MQSSVLSKNDTVKMEEEEEQGNGRFDAIKGQIATIARNNRMEIQKFKFSTDRVENGITIDFALRVLIISNKNNNGNVAED